TGGAAQLLREVLSGFPRRRINIDGRIRRQVEGPVMKFDLLRGRDDRRRRRRKNGAGEPEHHCETDFHFVSKTNTSNGCRVNVRGCPACISNVACARSFFQGLRKRQLVPAPAGSSNRSLTSAVKVAVLSSGLRKTKIPLRGDHEAHP